MYFDTESEVVLQYKINNYYDENEGEDDSLALLLEPGGWV